MWNLILTELRYWGWILIAYCALILLLVAVPMTWNDASTSTIMMLVIPFVFTNNLIVMQTQEKRESLWITLPRPVAWIGTARALTALAPVVLVYTILILFRWLLVPTGGIPPALLTYYPGLVCLTQAVVLIVQDSTAPPSAIGRLLCRKGLFLALALVPFTLLLTVLVVTWGLAGRQTFWLFQVLAPVGAFLKWINPFGGGAGQLLFLGFALGSLGLSVLTFSRRPSFLR